MSEGTRNAPANYFDARARNSRMGPREIYSGQVVIDELAIAERPCPLVVNRVLFMPGARTVWHAHPMGQVLHVVMGVGEFQREGEPIITIKPGDTVLVKPNERHWHGASNNHVMVHLAINADNDPQWFEPVER